jgi:hypothetical protein
MSVEQYLVRLLDECRDEINRSDSKASILLAAIAASTAFLGTSLLDGSTELRTAGAAVTALSVVAVAVLVTSMVLLALAIIPRVGRPVLGQARYFEEHAQFASHGALLAALSEAAPDAELRHAQQLLTLSRIASAKYRHLRAAIYAAGVALTVLCAALVGVAIA